jgi:hypothetical protein
VETTTVRKQHDELIRMASGLAEISGPPGLLRRDLTRFSTALRAHLRLEARSVYPALLAYDDAAIRDLAAEYQIAMCRLLDLFNAYQATWIVPGAIEGDRIRFARETASMESTVRRRIELENDNLYAAVERSAKAPA